MVGNTLTVNDGSWDSIEAKLMHQWLRNEVPVLGAVGSTYKLTAKDLERGAVPVGHLSRIPCRLPAGTVHRGKLKRKAIQLGVAGALTALAQAIYNQAWLS